MKYTLHTYHLILDPTSADRVEHCRTGTPTVCCCCVIKPNLIFFISYISTQKIEIRLLRCKQLITILSTDGGFSATDKARFLLNFNQGHLLHSSILPTKSSDQNIKDYTGVTIYAETPMYCLSCLNFTSKKFGPKYYRSEKELCNIWPGTDLESWPFI